MASAQLTPGEARRAQLQADIRRYGSACGCELASLFMVGAAALFIAHLAIAPVHWSIGETVWRGVLWVLSCSVVGKLFGLMYARVRLRILGSELRAASKGEVSSWH